MVVWSFVELFVVENESWDVDLPEEGCLLEENGLISYWLVDWSSFILSNNSFVRSNWILLASCKNVINSMRCFGIIIVFVSVGFVVGLLFCLLVADLVLVICLFLKIFSEGLENVQFRLVVQSLV